MVPRDTQYRLARSPMDYRRCRALQTEPDRLSWPTVMAERDGELIGFLGTQRHKEAVVAGPLVMARQNPITVMRLIEVYEIVLRQCGVTRYCFHVRHDNPGWMRLVEKFNLKSWRHGDGETWFMREVA